MLTSVVFLKMVGGGAKEAGEGMRGWKGRGGRLGSWGLFIPASVLRASSYTVHLYPILSISIGNQWVFTFLSLPVL